MLNRSWVSVDTCSVASSFSRLFAETAKFLNPEDYSLHGLESWLDMPVPHGAPAIRTARLEIRVPEVIVLKSSVTPKRRVMQFGRRNLMRRDRHTCQYCGDQPGPRDLTVDHVLPRRRGGTSTWLNCVASCLHCNSTKADKTPHEAGMALRGAPYEPAWSPTFKVGGHIKASWRHFLSSSERLLAI
jgi:5-methylcytosine-specific restriction endonuclease McrA